MKTIIAGSRSCDKLKILFNAIEKCEFANQITEIVSGGARGADQLGEIFAKRKNIPIKIFEADWLKFGRSAGPIRNKQMAEYADAAIILWDGKSKGFANMIEEAKKNNLRLFIYKYQEDYGSNNESIL